MHRSSTSGKPVGSGEIGRFVQLANQSRYYLLTSRWNEGGLKVIDMSKRGVVRNVHGQGAENSRPPRLLSRHHV